MLPKSYLFLNMIRYYSVICLFAVIASSGVIVVKSFTAAKVSGENGGEIAESFTNYFTQYIIPVVLNNLALSSASGMYCIR